jgi:hypothetical protein
VDKDREKEVERGEKTCTSPGPALFMDEKVELFFGLFHHLSHAEHENISH